MISDDTWPKYGPLAACSPPTHFCGPWVFLKAFFSYVEKQHISSAKTNLGKILLLKRLQKGEKILLGRYNYFKISFHE